MLLIYPRSSEWGFFSAPLQRCILLSTYVSLLSTPELVAPSTFDQALVAANDPFADINPDGSCLAPPKCEYIDYFMDVKGQMYIKDQPHETKRGLHGVIQDIFVWDNTKGNSYLAIKAKTSYTTGWQLNMPCKKLQYSARCMAGKLAKFRPLSTKAVAVKLITEQLSGKEMPDGTFNKATAGNVYWGDTEIGDIKDAVAKDPIRFMDAVNVLRAELGLTPQDRQWLTPKITDSSPTASQVIDCKNLQAD